MRPPALLRTLATLALIGGASAPAIAAESTPTAIIDNYADIAEAAYGDALTGAQKLRDGVKALLASPTPETLATARAAWKAARPAYMQTEAFRFGNAYVDDWEGKVNAWPLDEGLIDYVDAGLYGEKSDENPLYTANVIANKSLRIGRQTVDATRIDAKLLERLQEAMDVEKNVATGYHAIEFLLWGQDLNGTKPGAGNRPATDYSLTACTGGNCDRRRAYLTAATDLLISDLRTMANAWKKNGAARNQLKKKGANGGLAAILTGIGSLSYGELAGERIKLGLILHDPEEEHDCFSDDTHNSHYNDEVGIMNVWYGRYRKADGTMLEGPGLAAYVAGKDKAAADRVNAAFDATLAKLDLVRQSAESGKMAYDQMLAAGNDEGNRMLQDVVDGLVAQTRAVEGVVSLLKLKVSVEGSDALDNPGKVTQ
jgi:putative iron-regulated protein